MGVLKDMAEQKFVPEMTVKLLISNFEEVGFGASWVPEDVEELLAVDMGCVGDDLAGMSSRSASVPKTAAFRMIMT